MNNPTPVQNKIEEPTKQATQNTKTSTVPQPPTPPVAPKPTVEKGINLIPTLSKEEVADVVRKKKLNVGSIISLLVLVVVSILIVGFNIVSKMVLNTEKNKLANYEVSINKMTQKIVASNEISERIFLYQDILGETYSPKAVIDYIETLATKSGSAQIKKYSLGGDLAFSIEGEANDLEDISKFWYILSSDPKVETVTLQSVGNNVNSIRFSFKGKFFIDDFLNSTL